MEDKEQIKEEEIKEEAEEITEEEPAEEKEEKEEAEEKGTDDKKEEEIPIDINNPETSLKEKGFDYEELKEEYFKNGDLTPETREKLAKIGITDKFIEDFINGKKAQAQAERNEWAQTVGGRETFDKVIEWTSNNCTAEEIEAINSVHDPAVIKIMLKGLKAAMDEKEGVVPKPVTGGAHITADIFESRAQMFEAIRDKRYNTDPAYREKVTAKIRASRKAGINLGV